MSRVQLSGQQFARLERQLQQTHDAGVFRRTLGVLEVARGRSVTEIAELLRVSRASLHEWIGRYRESGDPACLLDHRGGNRPSLWTDGLQAVLRASLAHQPDHFGYQAVEWTVPLLQEHLEDSCGRAPSATALRQELHRLDYAWKRPRYRLQPDPEREKKTPLAPPASGLARTHSQVVRGRDRFASVSAVAEQLGHARQAQARAPQRTQRAAGRLRRH
jgi:transposase